MAADVPEESVFVDDRSRQAARCIGGFDQQPVTVATLRQTPRGAKTGRPGAENQEFDVMHVMLASS